MSARSISLPDRGIGELFEHQVAQRPKAPALRFRDRTISYLELNRAANQLSKRLARSGVTPGTIVAVAMPRTPAFVATLLGILKAGAAYLPVDPAWPAARLRTIIEVADVPVVVCDQAGEISLPDHVTRLTTNGGSEGDEENPGVLVAPSQLAYVNFTSGSTGVPKGVMIPHRAVASLLSQASFADLSATTVILQHSSPAFDAMTFELWGALLHGGTCVLFDGSFPSVSRLREAIRENGVTTMFLTTALFNVIIDTAPDTLESLAAVLTGGEAHSPHHIRRALRRLPNVAISNVYGPTEATVFATHLPLTELSPRAKTIPLGRPTNNREVFIARPDLTPAAPGETGEICIAGPGLALGYVGRPDLTAERFVIAQAPSGEPCRVYRTGDVGRCDEAGVIEFLGRADRQVKLNGFRIELEEVEYALVAHPEVRQAAVVVHGEGVTRAIKAAVVAPDGVPVDLPEFLAQAMPAYMIPADLTAIEALPLNTNGKIDRAAVCALFD